MGVFDMTGAGQGGKEFREQCLHRGTGAHWKAEEKKYKQIEQKAKRQEKRDAKLLSESPSSGCALILLAGAAGVITAAAAAANGLTPWAG